MTGLDERLGETIEIHVLEISINFRCRALTLLKVNHSSLIKKIVNLMTVPS